MSGIDAGFLYMETPSLHMHTIKIVVVEDPDYDYARTRRGLEARISPRSPLRRRLEPIPFGLGHPVWTRDDSFDIDAHLFRHSCPSPGGLREMSAIVSEISGTPLDRDRPLWEMHVVEGLEGGQVAFVTKIHHCVADGVAALDLLIELARDDSDREGDQPEAAEPRPGRRQLMALALAESWRRLRALPALLMRTIRGLLALGRYVRGRVGAPAPVPFKTTTTPFNASLTPRRSFAVARLGLPEVRRIKRHFDVTVNDVVLALCAGALRRLLESDGGVPAIPLLASVPVSTREQSDAPAVGNRMGNLITSLHTDVADPGERLAAIAAGMRDAKARHAALGPEVFERWVDYTPPHPYAASVRAWSALGLADHIRPPVNLIVSNVPGPRAPLTPGGARVTALYSVGPILEGIALNLTAWSYVDQLNVGILACADHDVDVWQLADRLQQAVAELLAEVELADASKPAAAPAVH